MLRVKIIQEIDRWGTEASCSNIQRCIDKKRFQLSRERRTDLYAKKTDLKFDVVYINCSWHDEKKRKWYPIRYAQKFRRMSGKSGPKLLCGVRGTAGYQHIMKANRIRLFDGVNASNKTILAWLKRQSVPSFLCEAGVNVEMFKPRPRRGNKSFTVGWAGNVNNPNKNANLVSQLGFRFMMAVSPTQIAEAKKRLNYKHVNMPHFYSQIDVGVCLSEHEGCNLPLMELAAMGLPIVSTDVGQVRELLQKEWIVKVSPRKKEGLKQVQTKIRYLQNHPSVRRDVGLRNRRRAVERWDWRKIVKQYEKFFMGVCA